jgi:6-phosphogluconolactonase
MGTLTPIIGSPFSAGKELTSVTVDPSGKFVYVTNLGDNNISGYTIDSATGALTAIVGSPFASGGSGPQSTAVDPTGKSLWFAQGAGDRYRDPYGHSHCKGRAYSA